MTGLRRLIRMWSRLSLMLLFSIPALALAQSDVATSGKKMPSGDTGAAPDTVMTMVSLGLGLLAVIAIIFGCAWMVRRMSGMTGGDTRAMKVVSVMPMGTRERIALIDVGGKQILIGVTPAAIRTLHVFDEPVVSPGEPVSSEFARKLQGIMGKPWRSGASDKEGS